MIVEYSFIIAVIPVILVVAFLVWIAKRITDGERLDMKEGVLGVVILMVALLITTALIGSAFESEWGGWDYDEQTKAMIIEESTPSFKKTARPWDGVDIERVYIAEGVVVTSGALTSITPYYIEIAEGATINSGAFSMQLLDWNGEPVQDASGKAFYAFDGTGQPMTRTVPYEQIAHNGDQVTGLSDWTAPSQWNLSIPKIAPDGTELKRQTSSLFLGTSGLTRLAIDTEIVSYRAFNTCTDLETARGNTLTIGQGSFEGCSSLVSIDFPDATTIDIGAFKTTSITSVELPKVKTIGSSAFDSAPITDAVFPETETVGTWAFHLCASLASVYLPKVKTIGSNAFNGASSIASVTFGSSLTDVTGAFPNWTFYSSDGTTQLDKTVASNLAGKTFIGTAAALIEVAPGQLTLTPQQIQQVHLHDTELQDLKDQISIEPLPLQPSLQEQELTA